MSKEKLIDVSFVFSGTTLRVQFTEEYAKLAVQFYKDYLIAGRPTSKSVILHEHFIIDLTNCQAIYTSPLLETVQEKLLKAITKTTNDGESWKADVEDE